MMLKVYRKIRYYQLRIILSRNVYNETKKWETEYNPEIRHDIERYWKENVTKHHLSQKPDGEKYYVLSMFPYPSGKLHMGHVRVYTISDSMARYQRLRGKKVIHPMGWDAFGLPAENAAIERNELPANWTYSNIKVMKKQLQDFCYSFDWEREYATCDPDYYKWTQWIFLKMYEKGLAYQKQGSVHWDPIDQTVLAEEQIDEMGHSWRSGAKVERKFLKQWYLKTTAYAKSLRDGLSEVDPKLWKDIIKLQKNWIGNCYGTRFQFYISNGIDNQKLEEPLSVFTSNPEAICGVSHIILSPEHFLNKKEFYKKSIGPDDKEDILLSINATHPFTGNRIPLIVSKKVDFDKYNDSKLGIPSVCDTDKGVADKFSLSYRNVYNKEKTEMINSEQFTGLTKKNAFEAVLAESKKNGYGGFRMSSRLNDWLVSRQRYWGTPIPIIHCPTCKVVPVPEVELPVKLPNLNNFSDKKGSGLKGIQEWVSTKCPRCGGDAERETDTMDTFVDSSWYFHRYLDPNNEKMPFSKEISDFGMPVDLYIGGKEHATLHLYFARFFNHFLHDIGLTSYKEPFRNLLTQGMVLGKTYQVQETGKYLPESEIDFSGSKPVEKLTGDPVVESFEKMSKSKYNGVDPQDMITEFGVDSTRLTILSAVSPQSDRNWSSREFIGILNWQRRIWVVVSEFIRLRSESNIDETKISREQENKIFNFRNYFIKEVTFHLDKTFLISTGISRLQGLTNDLKKCSPEVMKNSKEFEKGICDLIIMLSPFCPMYSAELWSGISSVQRKINNHYDWDSCVLDQKWPDVDENYELPLVVQNNGRDLFTIKIPRNKLDYLKKQEALEIATLNENYDSEVGDRVLGVTYLLEPGYRAILNFNLRRKVKNDRTIQKLKDHSAK